jgi:hypothetical protein
MIHADTLKRFILADKPEWCRSYDVAVIAYLLVVSDHGGLSSPTQHELASATGAGVVNLAGLRASILRLHLHGWIHWTKMKKAIGQRHTYQINFENLPGKEEHEFKK